MMAPVSRDNRARFGGVEGGTPRRGVEGGTTLRGDHCGTPLRGVYAITPDCADTAQLADMVAAALRGGIAVFQYRNKSADAALAFEQAGRLRALTRREGALLIINDDAALALSVGADGVHLGRADGDFDTVARLRRETDLLVGVSCYNDLDRARAAAAAGAGYVAFGAVFPSTVKPQAVRAGFDLIRDARRELSLPIVAIGGITRQNAPQLTALGVDAVALIAALFGAADIETEARLFCQLISPDEH